MYFPMTLRDAGGKKQQGRANILSLGETYLGVEGMKSSFGAATLAGLRIGKEVIWNVSYVIKYAPSLEYSNEVVTVVVAEGIYNTEAGTLCMRGCRYPSLPFVEGYMTTLESDPIDCEIIINIDLKALNQKVGEQKLQNSGTISSTRNKLDSLYFDPIQISSGNSYVQETMQFSWRIDAETMTVLISLTFSCICIHLQILQFKKHSGVIPSVSITMLVVLMLGYMMPLVLNLETLSTRHPFSEWPEVNQVAARVMNIVASFLCFRLLQVAWTAKLSESKQHFVAETMTVKLCLPLYFAGAFLIWIIQQHRYSLFEDLISYAVLVLNGFLLPQIVLNMCKDSKDKILSPFFIFGITIARAMPHLYNAFRACNCSCTSTPLSPYMSEEVATFSSSSYMYGASPDASVYFIPWNIIIPCEGFLFAIVIYLQQRVGGRCLLPLRITKS